MKNKRFRIIRGILVVPLVIGGRALLYSEGTYIHTSPVRAVFSVSDRMLRFETIHTNYRNAP